MGKKSFGMIMLIVVTAIVLLLAAEGWKRVATTSSGGAEAAAAKEALHDLPTVDDVQQSSDEHAARVQDALAATE